MEEQTSCCFAVQDKVWVHGPELPWEIYTVLGDAPVMHPDDSGCCLPDDVSVAFSPGAQPNACC
ncbi:MAG: hypothetical protein R2715_21985 [Ilumatobacteraceae bacterium]